MPNTKNINAPIVLISAGRSGTTLLSDIFSRHPDCDVCGETVDLIFDLWSAGQRSVSHIASESQKQACASVDSQIAQLVRDGFLSLLDANKPQWFHKPIGIPFAFESALTDVSAWDEKAEFYWKVMGKVFPGAKFFTILRHPCDIVMSYKNRFGCDEQRCWMILGFMAHIICHPSSLVQYAVPYNALAHNGETALRSLLAFLEMDFHPEMMEAFATTHTETATIGSSRASDFTWERKWDDLNPQFAQQRLIDPIKKLYRKFGHELNFPLSYGSPAGDVVDENLAIAELVRVGDASNDQMRHHIRHLDAQIRDLHLMWEQRAIRQENELYEAYLKLENEHRQSYLLMTTQIEELTLGKTWLDKQNTAWQNLAEEREAMLIRMTKDCADYEKDKVWLASQINAWRLAAMDLEARLIDVLAHPLVRIALKCKRVLRATRSMLTIRRKIAKPKLVQFRR
jgi:hypothetical protein